MAFRLSFFSRALVAVPLLAGAQPAVPADDVLVTASRLTTSAATTPYSAALIPGAELVGRTDVADALNELAEIFVQTPGGRSGASSIFLRGADPNFTVVLFDGVPLNNSTNSRGGAVHVAGINASALERVELVTGPLSSLYGSGALAGVINLMAPGGSRSHQMQTTLGAGTDGYWSAAADWQGPVTSGLGGSLGMVAEDDGEQTRHASFKSRTLTGKIAPFDREDAGRLIVRVNETDATTYPDSSGGSRLATRSGLEFRKGREQLLGLSLPAYQSDSTRLDLSASLLNRRDDTVSPGVAPSSIDPTGVPAGTDVSRYRRVAGQAIGRWDAAKWSLGAGIEALREVGNSHGNLDFDGFQVGNSFALRRSTLSGFAEANRTSELWTFNTGLRMDDVEGLASRLTARAGARYVVPGTRVSLRAAVGSGFKAPSFYAIGNPFVGNAHLKPEESVGGEFGMTWVGAPGDSVSITLFRTRFKDLIDFVPDPSRLENRNLVIATGVAVTLEHAFTPQLSGAFQTQYAQTRDDATDSQLMNRPQWRVNANLSWQPTDSLSLTVRYRHVGDRDDYAIPVGVAELSAYQVASLETAWTFVSATTARVVVDNIFDDRHEDALGFPAPGASARLLISRAF